MRHRKITTGLDLPLAGKPELTDIITKSPSSVALIGLDYHGMKPTLAVTVGDNIALGETVCTDKKNPGVVYTAPAGGKVIAINRGYQRALQSIVIAIDDTEKIKSFKTHKPQNISAEQARATLVESGLWTALRTRPFSKVPSPAAEPFALFINAMDTNPLAVNPELVINPRQDDYIAGLRILARMVKCDLHVCFAESANLAQPDIARVHYHQFSGKHPAGNVGTHMHYIAPVSSRRINWHLNYQDVIAIGALFTTGRLDPVRIISLGGPQVTSPKLVQTRLGADIAGISNGECAEGENRIISGSVLSGRHATGALSWLGRYHLQVSVIREGRERFFIHYLSPGINRFSILNIYVSKLFPGKKYNFTSSTNGSERAMVPIGTYEKVMPLDILPTQLLRSLIIKDIETATRLGCLELDEEDLALCTYVCPSKYEYGPILRENLSLIEKEGL